MIVQVLVWLASPFPLAHLTIAVHTGLFTWPLRYLQLLPDEARNLVRQTAAVGVSLSTHYSGMGCPEASLGLIMQALGLEDRC